MEGIQKKELDIELNLMPVISIMAVAICFLLSAAVWTMVGSVDLKQATGSSGLLNDRTPIVVVSLSDSALHVQVKNAGTNHRASWKNDGSEFARLERDISGLKANMKNLDSAIVLSAKTVPYQKIVSTLELLKTQGFTQVGLSSL